MYVLVIGWEYEGGEHRYFSTEGKAYKALLGALNSEQDGGLLPYFKGIADYWWIAPIIIEA